MENKEQQILSEIRSMMCSIRQQMEQLDAKMAELQQLTPSPDFELTPIDLDIVSNPESVVEVASVQDVQPTEETPSVEEEVTDDDLPFDEPEEILLTEETSVVESVSEVLVEEPAVLVEEEPVVLVEEPAVLVEEEPADLSHDEETKVDETPVKEAIIDAMTEKQAWRTDMPGTPVKDVRLAISLHERVLFINHLFSEDPLMFQTTINKINASESLEQVVDYVKDTFPQWNLDSDLVYRFMMAVRRKIR